MYFKSSSFGKGFSLNRDANSEDPRYTDTVCYEDFAVKSNSL